MRFADTGFNVHMPVFFDLSGLPATAAAAVGFSRVCVSREFHVLTTKGDSPAAAWVRNLAQHLSKDHGRKVGVVGMCFTGGLAPAAIADDGVGAAVVATSHALRQRTGTIGERAQKAFVGALHR